MERSSFKGRSEVRAGSLVAPAVPWARCTLLCVATLLTCACTSTTSLSDARESFGGRGRVATTQGSAVAVTGDERIVVATNRTNGIVSILRLDPSRPVGELVLDGPVTEIPFHPLNATKPWAAVIGADDDTAYVLVRGVANGTEDAEVVEIAGLHGDSPHLTGRRAAVGSEPTSIVISPSGKRIYVANSADGTISVIVTKDLSSAPLSLNGRLASSGPPWP